MSPEIVSLSSRDRLRTLSGGALIVFLFVAQCGNCLSLDQTREQVSINKTTIDPSGSGSNTSAPTNSTLSARNSRQLWSFVKNVIKTTLDQNSNKQETHNPVSGGLGALASLIGSGIASGINSDAPSSSSPYQYQNEQNPYNPPSAPQYPSSSQFGINNPNDYMHYLLLNSQSNQHTSLPHYHQQQQQSTSDLIEKYKEQMTSSSSKTDEPAMASTGNQILSKLALGSILDDFDLDKMANFLSFGSFEKMVDKVNKFDKLKCIPRLLCQMVAKRAEDTRKAEEEEEERLARSTTTTTRRPSKAKRKSDDNVKRENDDVSEEKTLRSENPKRDNINEPDKNEDEGDDDDEENDDDDEDDDDDESDEKEYMVIKQGSVNDRSGSEANDNKKGKVKGRTSRIFKVNGADLALEQFVK